LSLLHANDEEHPFEQWFVTWVRAAFKQKKMLRIHDLILWSEKLQDWEEKPKKIPSILYRNVP
jgi:hypothetical protein